MPLALRRGLVLVGGLALIAGLLLVATRPREVAGYRRGADGTVEQVALTCGSLAAGGGLEEVGEPTGVEVPQDEALDVDPGLKCPEEGVVWQAALLIVGVVVVGGVVWAWMAVGRPGPSGGTTASGP